MGFFFRNVIEIKIIYYNNNNNNGVENVYYYYYILVKNKRRKEEKLSEKIATRKSQVKLKHVKKKEQKIEREFPLGDEKKVN